MEKDVTPSKRPAGLISSPSHASGTIQYIEEALLPFHLYCAVLVDRIDAVQSISSLFKRVALRCAFLFQIKTQGGWVPG